MQNSNLQVPVALIHRTVKSSASVALCFEDIVIDGVSFSGCGFCFLAFKHCSVSDNKAVEDLVVRVSWLGQYT